MSGEDWQDSPTAILGRIHGMLNDEIEDRRWRERMARRNSRTLEEIQEEEAREAAAAAVKLEYERERTEISQKMRAEYHINFLQYQYYMHTGKWDDDLLTTAKFFSKVPFDELNGNDNVYIEWEFPWQPSPDKFPPRVHSVDNHFNTFYKTRVYQGTLLVRPDDPHPSRIITANELFNAINITSKTEQYRRKIEQRRQLQELKRDRSRARWAQIRSVFISLGWIALVGAIFVAVLFAQQYR